jgi:hypothetical protein
MAYSTGNVQHGTKTCEKRPGMITDDQSANVNATEEAFTRRRSGLYVALN